MPSLRYALLLILIIFVNPGSHAASQNNNYLDEAALIAALRAGGYNLYFRHESTDWSQNDLVNKVDDWLSCDGDRIRQLSDEGRRKAAATGRSIKSLGIPIARVMASPYCRTVETARLMGLGPVEPTNAVINLRISEFFGGRDAIIKTARQLLAEMPASGSNNLIVAHGNVAQAATPVYPGEGEGVVFKPGGNGNFEAVGRLTAEDWVRLAAAITE